MHFLVYLVVKEGGGEGEEEYTLLNRIERLHGKSFWFRLLSIWKELIDKNVFNSPILEELLPVTFPPPIRNPLLAHIRPK